MGKRISGTSPSPRAGALVGFLFLAGASTAPGSPASKGFVYPDERVAPEECKTLPSRDASSGEAFDRSPKGKEEPLEIVETRGGKSYAGRVVGYDAETKSYILLVDQVRVPVSESEILTIRNTRTEKSEIPRPAAEDREEAREPSPAAGDWKDRDGEFTLADLIAGHRSFPAPHTPAGLRALEEAMKKLTGNDPLSAIDSLKAAICAEGECLTASILLAAVHLDLEKDAEAAYLVLVKSVGGSSDSVPWKGLLARAARDLGMRSLHDRLESEVIGARFDGAEREYRLFKSCQIRDPERARKAWLEYRRLDPQWEKVSGEEARGIREATQALERDRPAEAVAGLSRIASENPLVLNEAKALLERAMSSQLRKAWEGGRYEVALGLVNAIAGEFPERSQEAQEKRNEIETACVKARLAEVSSHQELASAMAVLSWAISDLRDRFGAEVAGAHLEVARKSLQREGFEGASKVLTAGIGYGAVPETALLEKLADLVSSEISSGDVEKARAHLLTLSNLGAKDDAFGQRLDLLRTALAESKRVLTGPGESEGTKPAGEEVAAAGPSTPYLPLEAGSTFRYLYGDGSRETLKLAAIEPLKDGRTAYRFSSDLQLGDAKIPYQKTGYFAGGFYYIGASLRAVGGDPILKLPAATGERWSWRKGDIVCEREYVATDAKVTCRAGTFADCLKVKATSRLEIDGARSRPVIQWFYYAKGVGLVKIDGEFPFDGRELEEYRIGNDPAMVSGDIPASREPFASGGQDREDSDRREKEGAKPLLLDGGLGGTPAAHGN